MGTPPQMQSASAPRRLTERVEALEKALPQTSSSTQRVRRATLGSGKTVDQAVGDVEQGIAANDAAIADTQAQIVTVSESVTLAAQAAAAAQTAADEALVSANGKNKVTYSATAVTDTAGRGEGDINWVINSSTGVASRQQALIGGVWVDQTLASTVIAALDAAKITTGSLDAARIATNSLNTRVLAIGAFDNLLNDPLFTQPLGQSWLNATNLAIGPTAGRTGGGALVITNAAGQQNTYNLPQDGIAVTPGSSYLLGFWIYSTVAVPSAGATMSARFRLIGGATTFAQIHCPALPANTWTWVSGIATAPANATAVSVAIASQATLTTGVTTFSEPSVTRAAGGELIVDGAVQARHFTGATFTGVTMTGATFQTSATAGDGTAAGAGVRTNTAGIRAWAPGSSAPTFSVSSTTGQLTATGVSLSGTFTAVASSDPNIVVQISQGSVVSQYQSQWGQQAVKMESAGLTFTTGSNVYGHIYQDSGASLAVRSYGNLRFDALAHQIFVDGKTPVALQINTLGEVLMGNIPTTGSAANVVMSAAGSLFRSTSSKRYKTAIQDLEFDPHAIITAPIRPVSWLDINAINRWNNHHGEEGMDVEFPKRHAGLLAEDLHDAGLGCFVTYDDLGRPDAIQYDRLAVAMIPLLREYNDRLTLLEEA